MPVSLVEAAKPADPETLAVNGRTALEAHLPQTLIQTLAQRPSSDFRMKLTAEPAVPVPLESRVGSAAIGE
jgi:hypothetical protein